LLFESSNRRVGCEVAGHNLGLAGSEAPESDPSDKLAGASRSACKLQDNPRRLGKGWARLVGAAPLKPEREFRERRQDSPVSSGNVRALSVNAKKELGGQER
jgi:hypothetical protein